MWGRFSILARVRALALFVVTASAQDSLNVRQVGFLSIHWEAAFSVAVVDTLAFVATGVTGLRIVNIADPAHPVEIGYYDTPGEGFGVAVSGNYAYVADGGSGLRVVNITNPAAPTEVGHCDTPGYAWCVAVSGNYAYVASDGLRVVDITNPAAPSEVGFTPGQAEGVAVSGNYAYVAGGADVGLRVVNIANPAHPVETGSCDTPGYARGVAVSGNYAYVADDLGGLRVVGIANPAHPVEIGFCVTPGEAMGVAVSGNYAYVAGNGLWVVNITFPTAPTQVGFCNTPGVGVAVSGNYAYVADGSYFGIYDCSAATGISGQQVTHPITWKLSANFPNPFNPATHISFDVPRAERVTVNVYNITGQFVQTLVNERLTPGTHMIRFDGANLPSGTYFYRLASPDFSATRKMVLIK